MCLVMVLFLASCSEDSPVGPSSNVWTIEAGIHSEESDTRTSFVEDEQLGIMKGVYWSPGDCIGVYTYQGNENACFRCNNPEPSPKGNFAGTLPDIPVYAYYPYADDNTNCESIQATLPVEQSYSTVTADLHYDYKFGNPLSEVVNPKFDKFMFRHVLPMLRFVVNAEGTSLSSEQLKSVSLIFPADVNFHHGDFTFSAVNGSYQWISTSTSHQVNLAWSDAPSLQGSTLYGYYVCDAVKGLYGKEVTVKITTDKHAVSFKTTLRMNQFKPNYIYTFPLHLKKWQDKLGTAFQITPLPSGDTSDGLNIDDGSAKPGYDVLSVRS